jgi:hypothetical protein
MGPAQNHRYLFGFAFHGATDAILRAHAGGLTFVLAVSLWDSIAIATKSSARNCPQNGRDPSTVSETLNPLMSENFSNLPQAPGIHGKKLRVSVLIFSLLQKICIFMEFTETTKKIEEILQQKLVDRAEGNSGRTHLIPTQNPHDTTHTPFGSFTTNTTHSIVGNSFAKPGFYYSK